MALVMDPAGAEIEGLKTITNWRGKRVFEIGCVAGCFPLWPTNSHQSRIIAFDPDPKLVRTARINLPENYREGIEYGAGNAIGEE